MQNVDHAFVPAQRDISVQFCPHSFPHNAIVAHENGCQPEEQRRHMEGNKDAHTNDSGRQVQIVVVLAVQMQWVFAMPTVLLCGALTNRSRFLYRV